MARVVNEFIDVNIAGTVRVKQYFGTGPLMVKLPGSRGEYRAESGDYLCYDSDVDVCVGIVGGGYLDALREDSDSLDEEPTPTGAHLEVAMLDNAGAALVSTAVLLGQGGVPLAEGRTDDAGVVIFNVLPGTYQLRPKDATKGPEQTVEATLETEAPPTEGGVLDAKRRPSKPSRPRPDQGLPGDRFDVMGKPDPHGSYDKTGKLIAVQQR